ncbi:Uncharacterised protein [Klebsiella pneumoniae]|nr:Uncharacterised protein [Klebsiella pneumoniae]
MMHLTEPLKPGAKVFPSYTNKQVIPYSILRMLF